MTGTPVVGDGLPEVMPFATLVLAALATGAPPTTPLFDRADPAGDDRGPGSYTYPLRPAYPRQVFDLRRFRVWTEGESAVFEVTFARPIVRPPEQARRTRAIEIPLENEIFVKHVDIYVRDPMRPGVTDALPGRKIRFADGPTGGGWQRAIVLTPRPFVLESLLRDWPHHDRVLVPTRLRRVGRTLRVRVPLSEIGGDPKRWGYAVAVTGALWENRYDAYPEAPEVWSPNALTMPVRTVADRRRFGGGGLAGHHPHVIDLLAADADQQYRWLGASGPNRTDFAVIPFQFSR